MKLKRPPLRLNHEHDGQDRRSCPFLLLELADRRLYELKPTHRRLDLGLSTEALSRSLQLDSRYLEGVDALSRLGASESQIRERHVKDVRIFLSSELLSLLRLLTSSLDSLVPAVHASTFLKFSGIPLHAGPHVDSTPILISGVPSSAHRIPRTMQSSTVLRTDSISDVGAK